MRIRHWSVLLVALACFVVAASEIQAALTMVPRGDNTSIGVGIEGPPSNDFGYQSTIPAPPPTPQPNTKERIRFQVRVCCLDCTKKNGNGESCGPNNCTPSFSVEFTITDGTGVPSAVQVNDYPPADTCPLCVTYTVERVVDTNPPGVGSRAVNITNIPAECVCCSNNWSPWAAAYTFSRELEPVVTPP